MFRGRVYYYEQDNIKIRASIARYKFCAPLVKGKTVLDTGCGARQGPFIISESALKVFGLDISYAAIEYCSKNWHKDNVKYIVSDAKAIPFKNGSFDAVLSFEVIEHIDNYESYLSEVSRVLRQGGRFIISTPQKSIASPGASLSNPDHVREFELEEFNNILRNNFSKVTMYGHFFSTRVRQIEEYRKDIIQSVGKTPKFIKKLIPANWKEFGLKKYIYFFIKFIKGLDERKISEEDSIFKESDLKQAMHLLAVCEK